MFEERTYCPGIEMNSRFVFFYGKHGNNFVDIGKKSYYCDKSRQHQCRYKERFVLFCGFFYGEQGAGNNHNRTEKHSASGKGKDEGEIFQQPETEKRHRITAAYRAVIESERHRHKEVCRKIVTHLNIKLFIFDKTFHVNDKQHINEKSSEIKHDFGEIFFVIEIFFYTDMIIKNNVQYNHSEAQHYHIIKICRAEIILYRSYTYTAHGNGDGNCKQREEHFSDEIAGTIQNKMNRNQRNDRDYGRDVGKP